MTNRALIVAGIAATVLVGYAVIVTADGDLTFSEAIEGVAFLSGMALMWALLKVGGDK